ncbi:helix-turn-helix transcriptional regulator [Roseospira marina]|nr:AraC family transcriptional regulator [Roseospira marina]MBB4315629.1 AraC-like DNA-binding protein [Roseospira marina]MBB5088625.1 AraC-like DNA-binding protein [Roseospira marina]
MSGPAADTGSRLAAPHASSQFATLADYYTEQFGARDALRVRACAETRLCLELNPVLGSGRMDLQQFRNGLTLSVGDYAVRDEMAESYPAIGPHFGFSIVVDGRFDLSAPDMGVHQPVSDGEVWLRAGDIGAMHARVAPGMRMRGLSIEIPPEMAEDWRTDGPRALNAAIAGILTGSGTVCARVPAVSRRVLEIADALVDANADTACGRLHTESLALDLLARLLAPDADPAEVAGLGGRVGGRRIAALDEAMDILRSEWLDPPTIARLSRRVGLNECYLKAGFRDRFGTTIAGCVRALRMAEARRLIERDGQSVQQAAVAVGFSNPSHFAAAFRRVHGCAPSRLGAKRTGWRTG